jgi:hypothetical protein
VDTSVLEFQQRLPLAKEKLHSRTSARNILLDENGPAA